MGGVAGVALPDPLVPLVADPPTEFGLEITRVANEAALLTLAGAAADDHDHAAAYQPLDSDLTAIAALTTTSTGRSLLAAADAAEIRSIAGAGTSSLALGTSPSTQAFGDNAAGGSATDAAKTDHKHAMPANPYHVTFTVGPFYINDLAASTTTQATLGFFNTATALSRNANDPKMQAACHVIGLIVVSDAARTAGTATARVRVNGTGTTFAAGAVVLNATDTTSDSAFVAHASGLAISAGQTVGVDVVTSSWGPTTADLQAWLVVSLD